MNKYILIHKIINISILWLFPIIAFFIISFNNIKYGANFIVFLIMNIIEILSFISFFIVSSRCEFGTRKQHAIVKAVIALFIYIILIIIGFILI